MLNFMSRKWLITLAVWLLSNLLYLLGITYNVTASAPSAADASGAALEYTVVVWLFLGLIALVFGYFIYSVVGLKEKKWIPITDSRIWLLAVRVQSGLLVLYVVCSVVDVFLQ